MFAKNLGNVLVVVACLVAVIVPGHAAEMRLGTDVVPTFEAIRLKIDADQKDYGGSVRIDLEVRKATDRFAFHAEGQKFERVELSDAEGPIELELERGRDGTVSATAGRELTPGRYTLEIDFTHEFNTQAVGLYRMEQNGAGYLFTQFEAVDARKAFPCWDEPAFKIPFQMTLQVPESHTAVTNTPVDTRTSADGWQTVVFRKTRPMPSYLLAIASGPLESVPIPGMSVPGHVYTVKGQSHLAGLTVEMSPPILARLERYFGQRYPYAKLDVVAVPEYWFGGMENPGLVVCSDGAVLLDSQAASASQRRRLAGLLAHEYAHMWFGDLVTMEWWNDLWLNESFATYLGEKTVQELWPEYGSELARRRAIQGLMSQDARPSTRPIRGDVRSTGEIWEDLGLAYGKGRSVLEMMEQWIGPDTFRKGVTSYTEAHAWGNAVGDDLWNSLSKAAGKDVGASMSSFLDQSGLPLIEVALGPEGQLTLSQHRFLNYGVDAPDQTWKVPVRLRYQDGETIKTRSVMLDAESLKLDLGSGVAWVFPDDGAHGYYRFNLPRSMMVDLAENATDRLQAAERIVFIGNAAALLDAGEISGGDYLRVLNLFAADPEPEVVSSVVSGLGKVQGAFVPDSRRAQFASYVRATLRPVLDRFGRQAREGESETVSMLRPRLLSWLGDQGRDPEVRAYATKLALAYMADPRSVDPSVAGTVLDLAAIDGNRELFDSYRKLFETAKTPVERGRFLSALGSFEKPSLREAALSYALGGPVRPDETMSIPRGMMRTEHDADRMFEWFAGHYAELSERLPEMMLAYMPFMAGGCSAERLAAAEKFFAEAEHQVDGTQANLRKVAEQVADCVNLRQREGQAVAAYLAEFAD